MAPSTWSHKVSWLDSTFRQRRLGTGARHELWVDHELTCLLCVQLAWFGRPSAALGRECWLVQLAEKPSSCIRWQAISPTDFPMNWLGFHPKYRGYKLVARLDFPPSLGGVEFGCDAQIRPDELQLTTTDGLAGEPMNSPWHPEQWDYNGLMIPPGMRSLTTQLRVV